MKLYTMPSYIKLCTVFGYVLETFQLLAWGYMDEKEIPTFLRALFIFILTKKLQPLPDSSCPGPTHRFRGCTGGIVWGSAKGNGEARRILEQLPWRGFPSAALGGLQTGLAMDSKSWRARSEPKQSGQVFFSFALQVLDKASSISEKCQYEIRLPLIRSSPAKNAGFFTLPFGQLPFFGTSPRHEGHGRTVVIGALLKMEAL